MYFSLPNNPEIGPLPNVPPYLPKKSPEIVPIPEKIDPPPSPEIKPNHNPEIKPNHHPEIKPKND